MDINKVAIRALSGTVYVAIIVVCCYTGQYGITLLSSLLGILAIAEFRRMRFGAENEDFAMSLMNMLGGVLLINTPYIYPFVLWIVWLIWRIIATIYSRHEHPEKAFAVDMAAQLYIAFPLAMMNIFGYINDINCMAILSMFIIIWINDTGAFIFGSLLGHHKLFERVSPKKTWEGFIGGLICAVATGVVLGITNSPLSEYGPWHQALFDMPTQNGSVFLSGKVMFWTTAAFLISISATYGDLFESVIKRNLHLKDSGNLIPGHGGILDRIDSLLLVMPTMAVYIIIIWLYNMSAILSML